MKRIRLPLLLAAALLLAAPSVTPPARAAGTAQPDSVVGAYAAIACGFSLKALILSGGTSVPALWTAVGTCALMILDAMDTPD